MRLIHGFRSQALIRLFVTLALLVTVGAQFLQATTPVRMKSALLHDAALQAPGISSSPGKEDSGASTDNLTPAAIEGWVKSAITGQPVGGAIVTLSSGATASANSDGYFRFSASQVRSDTVEAASHFKVSVTVTASGRDTWSLSSVTYYSGDTLRLYPQLGSVGASNERTGVAPDGTSDLIQGAARGPQASLASFDASPPASVRVYRTQTGVVEVVPFRDYLKHTLPNEWIPSWPSASLKAGAMAVKTYAWYWISRGGKQVALGADLKDNIEDQVYDPNVSYASTDAAVDATFGYSMTRNGAIFQAQYCAGSYIPDPTGDCPWSGPYMTQWGSAYYADLGKSWGWLLGFYYPGAVISPTPPGGGYDGTPVPPTHAPAPTQRPVQASPTPLPVTTYVVGQGSNQADIFQEAYDRNGGAAVLGNPTGPVHWWMTYVSENNVLAQPFSGAQGHGESWIVFDVLKSNTDNAQRAYMLSGEIAAAYKSHSPVGPEWLGAPTSDPYIASAELGGLPSQGFRNGSVAWDGQNAIFSPWPRSVTNWKAEYFVGYEPTVPGTAPDKDLPGYPALVTDSSSPSFNWSSDLHMPQRMGAGRGAWSVQFTKQISSVGGSYDFVLSANSGARLWVDGLLAINGWSWVDGGSDRYNADLGAGPHTVRLQYFNTSDARPSTLDLTFGPRAAATPTPANPLPDKIERGRAGLRMHMAFLGQQPGKAQPVTLFLSDPKSAQVLFSATGQTDGNGLATFGELPAGTYNVHVKAAQSLQSARANIVLTENTMSDVDMKSLIMGDLDGDNCVTVDDFSVVQAMLGASTSTPGFNSAADLNGDGVVTMSDISLLRAGFDRCGDISADGLESDGAFTAMTVESAPSFSQALLPWTQSEHLDHTLKLGLSSASSVVGRGDMIEVQVVADTAAQAVDGASFIVSYDPTMLKPVDGNGNDASGFDPGVALPGVMGNWVDANGGFAGYSAGILQGDPPQGSLTLATIRFRVLPRASGVVRLGFVPTSSPNMQLTDGGTNLLATANGLSLNVKP